MRKLWILLPLALTLSMLLTQAAAEETVYTLQTADGCRIASVVYEPEVEDEYISADNHRYVVQQVEGIVALVQDEGKAALPDVSWLDDVNKAQAVSTLTGERRIALYCTHSDESYEPTDGYYTTNDRGSIYEVAQLLAEELTDRGVPCEAADMLHHPHDAGAYRRSRQTAIQLIKAMPDAIFDIHRDGIPDPDEYTTTIAGKPASKVRLLVGRGNQNMEVNKDFALLIKAVADKVYPGLIKDIYMGRGTYNQDLLPKALLLECGTYTLSRDLVDRSMPYMADVIDRALYGGVTGSAGTSDIRGTARNAGSGIVQGAPDYAGTPAETKDAANGMLWLVILLIVGLILYGVISTGSWQGGLRKANRHLSEMTGGLIGKKPTDKERR